MNIEDQLYTHVPKILSIPKEITCHLKEYKIKASVAVKIADNGYSAYNVIFSISGNEILTIDLIKEKIREELKQYTEFNEFKKICCGLISVTAIYNNNASIKEHGYFLIEFDDTITDYLRNLMTNSFVLCYFDTDDVKKNLIK